MAVNAKFRQPTAYDDDGRISGTSTPITKPTSLAGFNPSAFVASQALNTADANAQKATNAVLNFADFTKSNALNALGDKKTAAENAVANYGDFSFINQALFEDFKNQLLNRGPFSYDINGDALYQQYKDQYMTQGNQAMMDTMGQAAAMTGGYGNSYAQTVGQQTYQGYLQQLNNKIPELYQLALNKYQMEGQDLANKYGLLKDERDTAYDEWQDGYNKLVANRDYAGTDYYNQYGLEYRAWEDSYKKAVDAQTIATNAANNLYNREYGEHTNSQTMLYNLAKEAQAQANWQAEFDASRKDRDESVSGNYTDRNGNSIAAPQEEEEFNLYDYSYKDADKGVTYFTYDGKTVAVETGVNPYTRSKNPDTKHGVFNNGYQPDNIGGTKLKKTGETTTVNGRNQNVWTANGKKYVWDGTANKYYQVEMKNGQWVVK